MILITSNEQLTALLPNIAVTVTGETPLFNKLTPFLESAEEWVKEYFVPETMLSEIENCQLSTFNFQLQQIVAYDAFARALPHLDIILTPNGFGIVSNNNVAPASKERITRLHEALLKNRDIAIAQLLKSLSQQSNWLNTTQAEFFRATMFPNMMPTESWNDFLIKRESAILIEEFFATQYLSKELLCVLRAEVQSGQYRSMLHQRICRVLQAVEIRCLQNDVPTAAMHFEHGSLSDLVETIRTNPDDFAEWHSSPTAQLYNPPVFENKKDSKGYWF